jgi:type IX secretion system PorP/SprF family membrane protein
MMKYIVIIFLLLVSVRVYGQENIITLNQYAPVMYQPAWAAIDHEATLSVINRKTFVTSGISYQSSFFAVELPVVDGRSGRRLFGVGAHASHKDAGSSDLLKAINAGLSLSYELPLDKNHSIGFGLQSVYSEKRTSLESLTTGSQWLASEFRFDPNADLGERIVESRIRYFNINAGILWHWYDHISRKSKAVVSVSAFDLNRPNDSFLHDENEIPVSYFFMATAPVYQTQKFELWPAVFYQQTVVNEFRLQLTGKFHFTNENPYDIIRSGTIDLVTQFDFRNSLSLGILINQPHVSIGFSYNFGVAIASAAQPFRNGTEAGIRFAKTLWNPKPSTVVITNTAISTKRNFDVSQPRNQPPAADQPSDVDIIQKNIGTLAKVNAVRFELDKDFKFTFGKAELSAEAKLYLDDLVKLLKDNPEYNLEVIGHTDNVGKPVVNYRLSSARAQAVAQYLIGAGVPSDRIKHTGRGDTEPLAPNDSEENKSKNRRVHFVIYVNR